jgi:hypothetical protein
MKRRDFLKVGSLFSASAYFAIGPIGKMADLPLEAISRGKMYRGTRSGEIYTSDDGGKNWGLHTNFGPTCPIVNVYTSKNGQVYADVAFKPHHFKLALAQNGTAWMTLI